MSKNKLSKINCPLGKIGGNVFDSFFRENILQKKLIEPAPGLFNRRISGSVKRELLQRVLLVDNELKIIVFCQNSRRVTS